MFFGIRLMAVPFGIVQLMLLIDLFIFRIYRFHIDFFFIKMFFQDFQGMGASLLVVLSIILGFFLMSSLFIWGCIKFVHSNRVKHAGKFILVIFGVSFLGQSIHAWGYAHSYRSILSISPYIPWYAPLIATKEVKEWGLYNESLKQDQLNLDIEPDGSFLYPKKSFVCEPESPKNVIYVVIESWRFDQFNSEITPNIYKIGQDSLVFSNHLSGGNVTTNGMFSLFFGMSSTFKQKVESNATLPNLINSLKSLDYEFHLLANQDIVKNNLSAQLFGGLPLLQGSYGGGNGKGDAALVSKLNEAINPDKPFFSMVFFNDSHFPYKTVDHFPQPFQPAAQLDLGKVSGSTDPEPYLNQYSNSIHYIDHLVGVLKDNLSKQDLWDKSIVVISGDHGEEFNDQNSGYWGHGSKFDRYQIGVPLVIHWPQKQAAVSYRTAHEDISSTIQVEALGCQVEYADIGTGKSLFDHSPREIIAESYVNRAFIRDETVYEIYPGYVETYNLDGESITAAHDLVLSGFMNIQTWFNQ